MSVMDVLPTLAAAAGIQVGAEKPLDGIGSQYPINGTRVHLVPPPGWRAPRDWADYPIPARELQDQPARGYAPDAFKLRGLDWMHRGRGRVIYE
jgi:hypothetical protein